MSEALNRAASLTPGSGKLDLTAYATLDRAGAALDYDQKFSTRLSAFGQAWAGATRDDKWKLDAGVMGGLRYQW